MFLGRKYFISRTSITSTLWPLWWLRGVLVFINTTLPPVPEKWHWFSVVTQEYYIQYSPGIASEFSIFSQKLHVSWMCQQNWFKATSPHTSSLLLHSRVRCITQFCIWYITVWCFSKACFLVTKEHSCQTNQNETLPGILIPHLCNLAIEC